MLKVDRGPGAQLRILSFGDNMILILFYIIQESSYFGETACRILADQSNPVYNNFAIQESYNGELLRRRKECLITITSTNFVEMSLDLTVLLIVQLLPGLPTQCDRGPISTQAKVQVKTKDFQ